MLSLIKLSLLRHCSVFCTVAVLMIVVETAKMPDITWWVGDRCLYVPVRHCQRYQLVVKPLLLLASNHGFSQWGTVVVVAAAAVDVVDVAPLMSLMMMMMNNWGWCTVRVMMVVLSESVSFSTLVLVDSSNSNSNNNNLISPFRTCWHWGRAVLFFVWFVIKWAVDNSVQHERWMRKNVFVAQF